MVGRALVTGGAGFIGSHLCEKLLQKGYKVTCYDNLYTGTKENLSTFSQHKNFRFVKADVRQKSILEKYVKESDIVYHLAAIVGVSLVVKEPLENISVNIDGVKNVAEAALKSKVKVLFTSSSEVYGKNSKVPLDEEISESMFGSTKINRWAYGMAKALGEQILWAYKEKGLPVAVVRYFNCYGPRGINKNYSNVIPNFINLAMRNKPITIHGSGNQSRCFCYVDDTVKGTILSGEKLLGDVVNLGSNKEVKIITLAKKIKRLTKSRSELAFIPVDTIFTKKFESSQRRVPNIKKARKLLKFSQSITLEQGLKNTINWTKTNL